MKVQVYTLKLYAYIIPLGRGWFLFRHDLFCQFSHLWSKFIGLEVGNHHTQVLCYKKYYEKIYLVSFLVSQNQSLVSTQCVVKSKLKLKYLLFGQIMTIPQVTTKSKPHFYVLKYFPLLTPAVPKSFDVKLDAQVTSKQYLRFSQAKGTINQRQTFFNID